VRSSEPIKPESVDNKMMSSVVMAGLDPMRQEQ
jgi:hypothetical protein